MTTHSHNKDLTFRERSDAIMVRSNINQGVYRLDLATAAFHRSHNSGYCAYELYFALASVEADLEILKALLMDLGEIEHYNFEAVLAIAEQTEVVR